MNGKWLSLTQEHIEPGDILRYFGEVKSATIVNSDVPIAGGAPVKVWLTNGKVFTLGDGYHQLFRPDDD